MNPFRGTKLVIFDMDGVLADVNSSWAWIHQHFGVNNDESLNAYLRGEIDDEEFMRRDIALWRRENPELTKQYIKDVLKEAPLMEGCRDCLTKLKKKDYRLAVISGGLRPLVEHIGEDYFDWIMVNDIEEGLTGEGVLEVPLNDKGRPFKEVVRKAGVSDKDTVAIGNSFIDVPMLEQAGIGIAFNPNDEEVCSAADIIIRQKDLRLILDHI